MKKVSFCFIAAAFLLTGCVSTKTYKSAVSESESRKAQLEQARQEL